MAVDQMTADLLRENEALRAEVERLREREAGLLEQHSRDSAELRRVCAERDEARADERTAMGYLAGVRQVVGGEDFPDMVRRVREKIDSAVRNRKTFDSLAGDPLSAQTVAASLPAQLAPSIPDRD